MATEDFEQRLDTDPARIPAFIAAVAAWAARASLTDRETSHVSVALEELVSNVIRHGLGPGRPGWISVKMTHLGDCVQIVVRDNAPFFDPFTVRHPAFPANIAEREVGGLGVHFVRTLMDEYGYTREGGENVVTLRKRVSSRRTRGVESS